MRPRTYQDENAEQLLHSARNTHHLGRTAHNYAYRPPSHHGAHDVGRTPPITPMSMTLPPPVYANSPAKHSMPRHAHPLGDVNYNTSRSTNRHVVGSSVYLREKNQQPAHATARSPKDSHRNSTDSALINLFLQKNIDLKNSRKLGSGRYSKVITAELLPSGHKIAIKVINTQKITSEFRNKFLPREIECWKQLSHPNLVRILGHYEALHYVFLSMEYGAGGDLLTHIQKKGPMPDAQASRCVSQIVDGVYAMHKYGIAHRDLKLENVIVFPGDNFKIGDFGFAKMVNEEMSHTYCGSKSYSAPEILIGEPYSPYKSDVWSVGVIAYVVCTDCMPFRENQPNHKIVEHQRNHAYSFPPQLNVSPSCRFTIDSMLTFAWPERPDISRCKQLPWFHPQYAPYRH